LSSLTVSLLLDAGDPASSLELFLELHAARSKTAQKIKKFDIEYPQAMYGTSVDNILRMLAA
jgi:hypothetical protein